MQSNPRSARVSRPRRQSTAGLTYRGRRGFAIENVRGQETRAQLRNDGLGGPSYEDRS